MMRWIRFSPVVLLASAGCLASKGDIRLLQDEFRATRAQLGMVDTSIVRSNEQRRQQIATLAAQVDRLSASVERASDSLRMLASRFDRFQGTMNGEVDIANTAEIESTAKRMSVASIAISPRSSGVASRLPASTTVNRCPW